MYLIDTDMLSALRRRVRAPNLLAWISAQRTADLYLSVVSVGEVERGIARQERRDLEFPPFGGHPRYLGKRRMSSCPSLIARIRLSSASRWSSW